MFAGGVQSVAAWFVATCVTGGLTVPKKTLYPVAFAPAVQFNEALIGTPVEAFVGTGFDGALSEV